jgi:hypothetical protein
VGRRAGLDRPVARRDRDDDDGSVRSDWPPGGLAGLDLAVECRNAPASIVRQRAGRRQKLQRS